MKNTLMILLFISTCFSVQAQKYFTKSGNISFNASSPLEKIQGVSSTASTVLDATTGNLEMAVLIKSFIFEKALMQEHFNENYMESTKIPKASFKGKIENLKDVNFAKDGMYKTKITGDLTIHGVTKAVSTMADFKVTGAKIDAKTVFNVVLEDYKIDIPGLVKDKISKSAKVEVNLVLEKMK
ncbi:MAG TPA: YceI family protein [Saprospiraceae bacterium]|nr:YceI family protein [Saprospiraceae bacterium]